MKIGVLTFHKADNFGAALQGFALIKYLKDMGHKAEIINYYTESSTDRYSDKNRVKNNKLKMLMSKRMLHKRKKSFEEFRKEMSISKEQYNTTEEIKTANNKYDLFVSGSDQVWNYKMTNSDGTYLLNFVEDSNKKMAYASSFGLSEIEEPFKEMYQENLSSITKISVREKVGAEIVNDLTGKVPEVVVDPCLLLSRDEWIKISGNEKKKVKKKPYILVYMFTGKNLSKILNGTNFDTSKYDLVKINGGISFKDFTSKNIKVKFGIGPKEFIKLFFDADLVFTDSFHGTVFSVIFHKRFVTVLRELKGKNSRIIDFLTSINLQNRIYNEHTTIKDITSFPNYDAAQKKMDEEIKSSKAFLKNSVSSMEM